LIRIGREYGKSGAQVALRWFMEQHNVAAIPKAADRKHCQANLEIFDFSLSEEDMSAIAGLAGHQRMVDPAWAPAWDVV